MFGQPKNYCDLLLLLNPGKLKGKPDRLWDRKSQDCLNTNHLTPHLFITIDTKIQKIAITGALLGFLRWYAEY